MKIQKILLAPDAAPSGGGNPAPSPIPTVNLPPASPPMNAKTAFGLSEPPSATLDAISQRATTNLPKNTPYSPPTKPAPATPPAPPTPAPAAPAPEPIPTPAPATPAAPAAPEAPKKFKVAGKEYTEEELAAELARAQTPQPPAAPQPQQPQAPQQPQLTPEQFAAQERAAEDKWLADQRKQFESYIDINEKKWEAVLAGGAEGVAAAKEIFSTSVAAAVMHSRKQMFRDFIEPGMKQVAEIAQRTQELYTAQQQAVAQAAEGRFFSSNPDYGQHADLCRRAAYAIMEQYPQQFAAMTEQQQHDEVKRQVDLHLNAQLSATLGYPVSDWKEFRKQHQQPAAATPAPAPSPAAVPQPATPIAPPAAPAAPSGAQRGAVPTPPVVNNMLQQAARSTPPPVFAPSGGGSGVGAAPSWDSQVNADMRR